MKTFQGTPILKGHVDNGLYLPESTMALSSVCTSMTGWHNRLAHPHEAILRLLISTFHLPISTKKLLPVCEPCQFDKSHKHISCSKPFELMYSNVWGPSPLLSINGNRFFVLFIDDFTKFVWIYFLPTKS